MTSDSSLTERKKLVHKRQKVQVKKKKKLKVSRKGNAQHKT